MLAMPSGRPWRRPRGYVGGHFRLGADAEDVETHRGKSQWPGTPDE
jgi:hypothetical protein